MLKENDQKLREKVRSTITIIIWLTIGHWMYVFSNKC